MFGVGVHFAEADVVAERHEHRVIAKALVPTRGPDERAVDPAFEGLDMPVGPGEGEGADEMGVMACIRPLGFDPIPHLLHGERKVLGLPRPACGEEAGVAAERFDAQAAIVGERGQAVAVTMLVS